MALAFLATSLFVAMGAGSAFAHKQTNIDPPIGPAPARPSGTGSVSGTGIVSPIGYPTDPVGIIPPIGEAPDPVPPVGLYIGPPVDAPPCTDTILPTGEVAGPCEFIIPPIGEAPPPGTIPPFGEAPRPGEVGDAISTYGYSVATPAGTVNW